MLKKQGETIALFSRFDSVSRYNSTVFLSLPWVLYEELGYSGSITSLTGSLILPPSPPRASEERPWHTLVTWYFDNWKHQGGVLCNQAIGRVGLSSNSKYRAVLRPIFPAMVNKQLLDEVEHDIMNYQNRGLCCLPKPKAEADNIDTRLW